MKIFLRNEIISYIREPFASFFSVILPIILIFIYGNAFGKYEYSKILSGYDMSILFNIVFLLGNLGLMGLVMTIIEKRSSITLKREQVLPINRINKFLLNVFSSVVLAIIVTVIVIILNLLMYPVTLKFNILLVLIYFVIMFNFFAIGYNIATLDVSPRTAQAIGLFVFFICLFLSGLVVPFDNTHSILKFISTISPFNVSLGVLTAVIDIEHIENYSRSINSIIIYSMINIMLVLLKKGGKK